MLSKASLSISQSLLNAMGTRLFVHHEDRIPREAGAVAIASNHRSFMDAPILIQTLKRPIRIACHHYMSQTPILKEFVSLMGGFPLEEPKKRQQHFLEQASDILRSRQWVGVFPEGAQPMVKLTNPREVSEFQRGFAHLALRSKIDDLAILPVAIASEEEFVTSNFPLRLLSLFDPSEPLFDREGSHPMVIYRRVSVSIGRPYWISDRDRQQYRGKGAKQIVTDLTDYCRQEIVQLLQN